MQPTLFTSSPDELARQAMLTEMLSRVNATRLATLDRRLAGQPPVLCAQDARHVSSCPPERR